MQQHKNSTAQPPAVTSSYRETRIGDTLYRVTSVYLGRKDLKDTLEKHIAAKVYNELTAGANSRR